MYVHTLLLCYLRVSHIISQATHKWVSSLNWAVLYLIKMHLDGFIFSHKNLFVISIWVVVIPLGITKTQTDICKDREICSCLRSPLLWDNFAVIKLITSESFDFWVHIINCMSFCISRYNFEINTGHNQVTGLSLLGQVIWLVTHYQ